MRDFVLKRLAAYLGAVLGTALLFFVALDLLLNAPGSDRPGLERLLGLFAGSGDAWLRLGVTLPLALLALAIAATLGMGLAHVAAGRLGVLPARLASGVASILTVLPPFWLGILLALLFAGTLKLLPASGFVPWSNPAGALASLLLPAVALGLPHAGQLALRLAADTADRRPGGVLPILGRTFAALLVAATLVENVFYLPGLGRLVLGAAEQHDLVLLRGGLFVLVLVGATGMLAFSMLRLAVEPELRR